MHFSPLNAALFVLLATVTPAINASFVKVPRAAAADAGNTVVGPNRIEVSPRDVVDTPCIKKKMEETIGGIAMDKRTANAICNSKREIAIHNAARQNEVTARELYDSPCVKARMEENVDGARIDRRRAKALCLSKRDSL